MNLKKELAHERKQLSGLVTCTEVFIGNVAKKHFKYLSKLPGREAAQDPRLAHTIHATAKPTHDHPAKFLGGEVSILGTFTEEFRRGRGLRVLGGELRLPGKVQEVSIDMLLASNRASDPPNKLSIAPKGYAAINNSVLLTRPRKLEGDLSRDRGYASVEELRHDYADSFIGALSVAGFVDMAITAVHRTRLAGSQRRLDELLFAWHQVAPQEKAMLVSERVLDMLPRTRL